METQPTAQPKLYIGMDIHKKSWSVHLRTDISDHKTLTIPPDCDKLYDYVENKTDIYTERLHKMQTNLTNVQYIELAKTDVVTSKEQLDALYIQYLEDGYEGQMVRDDVAYEHKRTKHLLKRKEFITDEFTVVEILEGVGNWAGYAKRFVIKLPSGVNCGAGVKGDRKTLKELWDSKKNPDWATVRYFTPTPDGIPRFPVVITWGMGKREY